TRDAVAPLGPPPADRDDLAVAWAALSDWTLSEVDGRTARRAALSERVAVAEAAATEAVRTIATLFRDAGLDAPRDPDAFVRAAAVALAQAQGAQERLVERRAQAEEVRAQRSGYERAG